MMIRTRRILRCRLSVGRDLLITPSGLNYSIAYTDEGLRQLAVTTVDQAIEIVRNRIDETGTKEPIIQRQGQDRILASSCPASIIPKRSNGCWDARLSWAFEHVDVLLLIRLRVQASGRCRRALNCSRRWMKKVLPYLVRKRLLISGDMLDDARPGFGQNNDPVVNFTLNATGGAATLARSRVRISAVLLPLSLTERLFPRRLFRHRFSQTVRSPGGSRLLKPMSLPLLLRAGALPAPLVVL